MKQLTLHFKKLKPKDRHAGCTRCNYQGCVWMREKYGESIGHVLWTLESARRNLVQTFKNFYKSLTALDYSKISDVEITGIKHWDCPDYADLYISSAFYKGRPMTERELDKLNSDYDFVRETAERWLY